jgi:hypothetical protein
MWKEVVMAITDNFNKPVRKEYWSKDQDSKLGLSIYKAGVLLTRP